MRLIPPRFSNARKPHAPRRHGAAHALGRRGFLAGGVAALLPVNRALAALGDARRLAFDNLHTGEKIALAYWEQGQYLPDALAELNHLLRDFRTGDVHAISVHLLDTLALLHAKMESSQPFDVISGYRSPLTNAMLRAEGPHSGVASNSLHMQGMAMDIRLPGRTLSALRDAALGQHAGGVGYYPASDFVHVDVGRIRRW